MRSIILAAVVLLAACTPRSTQGQAAGSELALGNHGGTGRDALCIAGTSAALRAGFIAYGVGDSNCSAIGRLTASGGVQTLIPNGDTECRIPLKVEGDRILIGPTSAACAYYCGAGAALDGKSFATVTNASPATDLAGTPLC